MYSAILRQQMFSAAYGSIQYGLDSGSRLERDNKNTSPELMQPGACFVSLSKDDNLRGCIGTIKATEPLINNIAYNAYSAAFDDPRFSTLNCNELENINIEIAVLSDTKRLSFNSEQQLIEQLRPDIDGLVIYNDSQSATFLPSVWQQLPAPAQFLSELKIKAGWDRDYWSEDISAECYSVKTFTKNNH
ncbi:MAG: AmmeMemoRadiSam system protein A [Oceanicoccus sp.]|jgi:AmmeMemoRadiSam system protein A